MNTASILQQVRAEIARLTKVAALLEDNPQPTSAASGPAPSPNARKGHKWSAKARAEMSRKLKASWAARQKKSAKK